MPLPRGPMRLRRLPVLAVVTAIAVLSWPASASAHSASGQPIPDAAHYRSAITAVTPTIPVSR